MPGRRFAPLLLLLLLVSDLAQGAAAFDSAPSPESLPSVAGIGDHWYDTKGRAVRLFVFVCVCVCALE